MSMNTPAEGESSPFIEVEDIIWGKLESEPKFVEIVPVDRMMRYTSDDSASEALENLESTGTEGAYPMAYMFMRGQVDVDPWETANSGSCTVAYSINVMTATGSNKTIYDLAHILNGIAIKTMRDDTNGTYLVPHNVANDQPYTAELMTIEPFVLKTPNEKPAGRFAWAIEVVYHVRFVYNPETI